jgi:hypothetical protein
MLEKVDYTPQNQVQSNTSAITYTTDYEPNMAPKTPKKEHGRREWDTVKRSRFLYAFDSKSPEVS